MKTLLPCLAFMLIVGAVSASSGPGLYELRTYTAEPGKKSDLVTRLADASELFAKHGMTNVAYWTPIDEKDGSQEKVIYLLGHQDRAAAAASWKAFDSDPAWQALKAKNEAAGKVVAKLESVFLTPTDYSPATAISGQPGGVFELRTYTTPDGKLAGLDTRFRDHTMDIFKKHGMTNGRYFHPVDADKGAANTLVYWLRHESREAATASWKAFQADPEWIAVRTASEKEGKLTVSVKSIFLRPLDFSPLK